jgi:hypothetical protein
MTNGTKYILKVDGNGDYVEVPSHKDLTIARDTNCNRIGMTIHVEFRPDVLNFPKTEGTDPYVNFLGKNNPNGNNREWSLRIYNNSSTKPNRIVGYIFTPDKINGVGNYFQDPIAIGEWIKVTVVVDSDYIYLYKNGILRRCCAYSYISTIKSGCVSDQYRPVYPEYRNEPMRIGTDYLNSYFLGAYREVRKYDRPLSSSEVLNLANGTFTDTTNLVFWHNYRIGNAADQSGRGHDGILHGDAHFEIDTGCIPLSCAISCPSSVNQGDTATLTITSSGGISPFTYSWSITKPDATIDKYVTQNVSYSFIQQGIYSINCNVADSCSVNIQTCNKTCSVSVVVPSTNIDKFGIKELYQTISGGREWYSKWDNGHARAWNSTTNDPDDPDMGNGDYKADGLGIFTISREASTGESVPRMYIVDPNKVKMWHNIEVTVYGMRVSDLGTEWGGIMAYARINHTVDSNDCDDRGYGGRFCYNGDCDFEKIVHHNNGETWSNAVRPSGWSNGMPYNVWIGYKFVVHDLSTNGPNGLPQVKLEIYMDTTNGLNGGTWIKINEFIDTGNNWGTNMDRTCNPNIYGITKGLQFTASDNRIGSETGKPNLAVFFRSDDVNTNGLLYKKASIREILPP